MKQYTSSGKFLLTAEYSVLQGAEAIAVPTILGQSLAIKPNSAPCFLRWQAFDNHHQLWLIADFDQNFKVENTSGLEQAELLGALLRHAFTNSNSIAPGTLIETNLEFNRKWGLGSSSTLVHLVAQLAGCNAMELYFKIFKGSGYDVAVAIEDAPIQYQLVNQKATWQAIKIPSVFSETKLVYLQHKQNSQEEVERFQEQKLSAAVIQKVSALSRAILNVENLDELAEIMTEHENITAQFLGRPTVQEDLFSDFEGTIKSLGAWGGDFIWVIPDPLKANYFTEKGYETELDFRQLVIS